MGAGGEDHRLGFDTSGEDYRLAMYYRPRFDPNVALQAVWSSPALCGPLDQHGGKRTAPFFVPDVDEGPLLHGLVALRRGVEAGCLSYCVVDDDGIDLVFGIPLGQLARVWPDAVDEQHFGGEWELPVEDLLLALARHVYARAPFQRALTGIEAGPCTEQLEPSQPLPTQHGLGIIEPTDGEVRWHPPTERTWPGRRPVEASAGGLRRGSSPQSERSG